MQNDQTGLGDQTRLNLADQINRDDQINRSDHIEMDGMGVTRLTEKDSGRTVKREKLKLSVSEWV